MNALIYLDTSALIKRYVPEKNSRAFDEWFVAHAPCAISRLTFVEVRSTLARKRREKVIGEIQEREALNELRTDLQDGVLTVFPGSDAHFVEAFHLIDRLAALPLRTLDALHLAIARLETSERLATADRVMLQAAQALGIETVSFAD